ncbi:MAG TPA: ArdC family protein [Solirubrobacterales bacterium]|nr:ArdC family protein [Solirubrobacterales bacterium]
MKPSPKVEAVAEEILAAFRDGRIPAALAQIFIHRKTDSPSLRWSLGNRLIAALHGHFDARGFRQWKAAGRHVKRGEHAFYILGPCLRRRSGAHELADTGSGADEAEELVLTGLTAIAVFGYAQTEGEPLPGEEEGQAFVSTRPLIDVARSWGLAVTTFTGEGTGRLGSYRPGAIALGVENLSTWSHELVHAADHRLGTLSQGVGQRLDNEVVAELGGAVLLECLGYSTESDRGGAYAYIERYCRAAEREVLPVCMELLDRVHACVALILDTAAQIASSGDAATEVPS